MQRRRFDPGSSFLAALVCAAAVFACERTPRSVGAFDLHRTLAGAARCHVSVPDEAALALVRAAIARAAPQGLEYAVTLEAKRAKQIGDDPRIWLGTPMSPGAEAALARMAVSCDARGFRFHGQEYAGPCDGLIATVPDPERPSAILQIVLANDLAAALRWVRDWTPTARVGVRVIQGGAVKSECAVGKSGEALEDGALDVALVERRLAQGAHRGERIDFDWVAPAAFDAEQDASWLDALDRASAAVRARLNPITPFDAQWRIGLRILETPEDLARSCRARGFAFLRTLELREELSLVHVTGAPDNAAYELARAIALAGAGEPRAPWLADAVAAASAGAWFERPRADWLAHLWTGELVPSVEQLVRDDSGLSPHVVAPLRGALLEACEESLGADFAAQHWKTAPESIPLLGDEEFRAWLTRTIGARADVARNTRAERRAASLARAARRGACLLPSASIEDPFAGGFGSRDCDASLAQLHKLGASAVALCWCTALEASEPRVFGAGRAVWTQADDAALYFTILRAQRLDLSVALLPQLVATENGGWAGQVMLTTPKSQRALFAAWRRYVTHLGLLAELAGVDVLSLGSDAPDTAVTRESDRNRRSAPDLASLRVDWGFLIGAARGAFGGGLTYAARWDGEAQGIEFWKELDFLGQNVFVPYGEPQDREPPSASDFTQRIVAALVHLSRMSKDSGVRGLVTGIGISSTAGGWRQPSRPKGELDLELQTRFYAGLMKALQLGRRQEFAPAGLFAWCWWTRPESGGATDRGFTPQNKPAQAAFGRALQVR